MSISFIWCLLFWNLAISNTVATFWTNWPLVVLSDFRISSDISILQFFRTLPSRHDCGLHNELNDLWTISKHWKRFVSNDVSNATTAARNYFKNANHRKICIWNNEGRQANSGIDIPLLNWDPSRTSTLKKDIQKVLRQLKGKYLKSRMLREHPLFITQRGGAFCLFSDLI